MLMAINKIRCKGTLFFAYKQGIRMKLRKKNPVLWDIGNPQLRVDNHTGGYQIGHISIKFIEK